MPKGENWLENNEIISKCGDLFPFITTKTSAVKYAKSVKRQFPTIELELYEGDNWGSLVLVQSF